VLNKQLREQWRVRGSAVPIYPVMTFASDGLVLGAGTVLLGGGGATWAAKPARPGSADPRIVGCSLREGGGASGLGQH
jgi:hypothetical protein